MIEKTSQEEEKLIIEICEEFCNLCVQKRVKSNVFFVTIMSIISEYLSKIAINNNIPPEILFNDVTNDLKYIFNDLIEKSKNMKSEGDSQCS